MSALSSKSLTMLRHQGDQALAKIKELVTSLKVKPVNRKELISVFSEITTISAETLKVHRSSIWFFHSDMKSAECLNCYDRHENQNNTGFELAHHPDYFEAITKGNLSITNASKDPRTQEYTENVLKSLGINSILTAPIRYGAPPKIVGVFQNESDGERKWNKTEEEYANNVVEQIHEAVDEFIKTIAAEGRSILCHVDFKTLPF